MKHYLTSALILIGSFLPCVAEVDTEAAKTIEEQLVDGYDLIKTADLDSALIKFQNVLADDSENLSARFGIAITLAEQECHEDALKAYKWITQQYPKNVDAWSGRGLAAFNLGDFDEALHSFQRSIENKPMNAFLYESIAWIQMCRREFQKAAQSAKQATLLYNQTGNTNLYPLLIAYFSYHESGDSENALRALRYASKNKLQDNEWPSPVIDYLNKKINQDGLISHVSSRTEETEAHTYIGLYLRLLGKTEKANRHFHWVEKKGDTQVFEHMLAKTLRKTEAKSITLVQ